MSLNLPFHLKLYLSTVPIFFLIDLFWLGFVAKEFYRRHLDYILSPKVNWPAAISFDEATGALYVADMWDNVLVKID